MQPLRAARPTKRRSSSTSCNQYRVSTPRWRVCWNLERKQVTPVYRTLFLRCLPRYSLGLEHLDASVTVNLTPHSKVSHQKSLIPFSYHAGASFSYTTVVTKEAGVARAHARDGVADTTARATVRAVQVPCTTLFGKADYCNGTSSDCQLTLAEFADKASDVLYRRFVPPPFRCQNNLQGTFFPNVYKQEESWGAILDDNIQNSKKIGKIYTPFLSNSELG